MPKQGWRHSEETKARISQRLKGRPSPMKGRTASPETRAKMSAAHLGKKLPPKTVAQRQRYAAAQRGRFGTEREQFDRHVRKTRGCWWWEGSTACNGYSKIGRKKPYRLSYEWFVGPILPGNHIHHKCHNKLCVKPAHLVQLSSSDHRKLHLKEAP